MDPENFGDLERTAFSLFQVSTGDSWASSITRGLIASNPNMPDWAVHTFFVVFFLIVGVVLMNVVVAILLDEFLSTVAREKAEQRKSEMFEKSMSNITIVGDRQQPLDPLLAGLVTFATEQGLLSKIADIYETMDVDEAGSMSREKINAGLKLFSLGGQVQLSSDDWEILSEHGEFLNADGEMGPAGFEAMILNQLRVYTNRKLAMVMNQFDTEDNNADDCVDSIIILALKMIMNYVHQLQIMMTEVHSAVDPEGRSEQKKTRRSRMEVIMGLRNLPLRRAFTKWALEVKGLAEGAHVLSEVIKQIDNQEGHGEIGFEEFASLLAQSNSLKVSDPVAHARRIFRHLDEDGSGTIDKEEVHAAIRRIENEMSDRDLLLRRLDLVEAKLDAFRSDVDALKSDVKSTVLHTVDVRLHECMDAVADNIAAKVLGALVGNVRGGGGIATPVTRTNPIMATTQARGTTDLAYPQKSLHVRRRDLDDIRREIAASMSVPLKESSHAEESAIGIQSNEVMVQLDEARAHLRYCTESITYGLESTNATCLSYTQTRTHEYNGGNADMCKFVQQNDNEELEQSTQRR
jgi:hypothetical protein